MNYCGRCSLLYSQRKAVYCLVVKNMTSECILKVREENFREQLRHDKHSKILDIATHKKSF